MSDSPSDFGPLARVKAKLEISERLILRASEELRAQGIPSSRRAELQRIVEDTRRDMARFQRQKDDLEKQ